MTELEAELGIAIGVNEADDPTPRSQVLGAIHPRAAWGDPSIFGNARHLGVDKTRSALSPRPVVHEMKVVGRPVVGRIRRHG